jgi:hypothetical protein
VIEHWEFPSSLQGVLSGTQDERAKATGESGYRFGAADCALLDEARGDKLIDRV